MTDRETLDEQVTIRLTRGDRARLTALGKRITVMSQNAIARAALKIGMGLIEEDPGTVLRPGGGDRARDSR